MRESCLPIEIDTHSPVWAVTFLTDGKHLVSGDYKSVRVWKVEDEKPIATIETGIVDCLAVSQDGRWIAAGTNWGYVFVWDTKTQEQVFKHDEDWKIHSVDFSPDSTQLIVALAERATVWDFRADKQVQTLEHGDGVSAAKYSQLGDRIATATKDRVRVWDSNDGRLLVDIKVRVTPVYHTGLCWFNDHLFVVSDGTVKQLDASTGTTLSEWPVHNTNDCSCISIPKHGDFIAYASKDTVTFFDMSTHSPLSRIQHPRDILSVAFSESDRFIAIGGEHGKIRVESLSYLTEPIMDIDDAVLDAWNHNKLEAVHALLTDAINASQHPSDQALAARGLVRAHLRKWNDALLDAEMAISTQPSVIAYIAKSIAHVRNGERDKAYRACDVAFTRCRPSRITFLLLIKAIIVFMAGEHVDAMTRVDDLIATLHTNLICHVVQAHMHLLLGVSHMEHSEYEDAIRSFEHARAKLRPHQSQTLFIISLISGWKFNNLNIVVRRHLCEALYSAGRTKDAGDTLLELVHTLEDKVKMCEDVTRWVSDFVRRCLSTPESDGELAETHMSSLLANPTPLLREWAKLTLERQSWKDALNSTVPFIAPKFTIYRVICEHLEATERITAASECLLEMASELARETNGEQMEWVVDLKHWCGAKLGDLGDLAMNARQHDKAITQYSAALLLNLTSPQVFFVKRSEARARMGAWEDALNDANEAIILDLSSPLGYERKYAALNGARCHADARLAFETMLSKMSESADPKMQERSRRYVKPFETEAVIREAIEVAIRESPLVLINTDSGRLLDKLGQTSSFQSQPIFHELVTSMTTNIDRGRIESEVGQYYRYAMFSHKWKEGEPLYDQVVHAVVYNLEDTPTHVKLQTFCRIAREAGLRWAWSDTCCINKSDSSILQEALVSMFQWYQGSTLTVVLLCDVPLKRLGDSIWNSRAWTFQEYHASKVVRFYNKDWTLYRDLHIPNHKDAPEIIAEMEEATGISAQALIALRPGLEDIREKLRLASTRQTTRIEDAAYSLLGIFSLTLPVVYGEGDKALGQLLAKLLTSSGDTSILAWTGGCGSFNSCLPAKIAVFNQLPTILIPPPVMAAELENINTGWKPLDPALVATLSDRLHDLPLPLFNDRRMKLPGIVFKLGALSVTQTGSERVFRAQTNVLGVVEIKTEENLFQFKSLCLVHPWIDYLLDRQPVGRSKMEVIPEECTDDRASSATELLSLPTPFRSPSVAPRPQKGLTSRFGFPFRQRTEAPQHSSGTSRFGITSNTGSLAAPSTLAEEERQMKAFQVIARLRQPFGALLLTPDPANVAAYRRVASETLITVQVQEITPAILDRLITSVRVLGVL